jgi:transposase
MRILIALIGLLITTMLTPPADAREAGAMLPLLQRHEIQVLLSAKLSPAEIAQRVGVSVDTVLRVGEEPPVAHVDDTAERRQRRVGRPPKVTAVEEHVRRWLAEEPDLPTQELLRRALGERYTGAKSAFYQLVARLRPTRSNPVVRFEGLPGEFSQHDFGHVDVRFVDGRSKRVHFFASRLKFSRFVAVSLVLNEQTETLVRTLVRHFVSFGGVPLLAVFDRPRTVVTKGGRGREVTTFNATFAQVMLELGVGVEMCAPRSGNQKGAVEQLVKWVKGSFFKCRKFLDEQDLEAQLVAWERSVNFTTPSRATGVIPETRRQQEMPRLRAVRVTPATLALRIPVVVGPSAEIAFEGRSYSMPPRAAHTAGTAFVYEDRIRFVAGRFEATHARGGRPRTRSTLPEHRAEKLTEVHGTRAVQYEKRQQLLDLGDDATTLLTALVHRSPAQSLEDIAMLHALYAQHGDEAMRSALTRVVAAGALTVDAVIEVLAPNGVADAHEQLRAIVAHAAERAPRAPRAPRAKTGGAR